MALQRKPSLFISILLLLCLFILQCYLIEARSSKVQSRIKQNINQNIRSKNQKEKHKKSRIGSEYQQDSDPNCENEEYALHISMNSDETEMYFLDLDQIFPFNNFTVTHVDLIESSQQPKVKCDQDDKGDRQCQEVLPQKIIFQSQNPTVIEELIYITAQNDPTTGKQNEDQDCPDEGINMIASKAPEDQPVHIFLSSDYVLYVIIFDDTQHPVSKIANYSKNLNSYIEEDEKLVCMDIEVYDSGNRDDTFSSRNKNLQDDPKDDEDCLVYIDCNIIKEGEEDQQNFAMIFVPLKKDYNDIIKSIGEISIKRYQIPNPAASDYFYNCPQRVIDNYSSTLIMYCPHKQNNQPDSNILFFKNLQNGVNFPNPQDIIFIEQSKLQKSNCQGDGQPFQIQSLVSNPLYQQQDLQWQFSLLLSSRICKCRLSPDEQSINCSSIQLSDSDYHEMVYIQEESVLTLFVGSNTSIDEIQVSALKLNKFTNVYINSCKSYKNIALNLQFSQDTVGESMFEDGQNLIVGSLGIVEKDLVLTKITVNSEYIMAQMKNTSFDKNGDIDVVVKIFSRTNENSFLHYYQQLESPIELYQNDNFYDMGNYIMVYSPMICILNVTRVTQKPLVIATQKINGQKLQSIQREKYKIYGNYSVLNSNSEFETKSDHHCLMLELVPFSQQVLSLEYTIYRKDVTWEQQMINVGIKDGVTGSLLYYIYEPNIQDDKFQSLIDYNQTISVKGDFFVNKTIFYLGLNDTNKLYNPVNYRAIVSDYKTPCVIEQYYCDIINFQGQYYTGDYCIMTAKEDLSVFLTPGETCKLDTYSEGYQFIFVGDKSARLGFMCSYIKNKLNQLDEYKCWRVNGDFFDSDVLIDLAGNYQGYKQADFYSDAGASVLVTVTEDSKKLILYMVIEKKDIYDDTDGFCSQIFLIVDQTKLSSLAGDGRILQMDSYFLEEDFIFLLTSDLRVYVLTRIQQLYLQNAEQICPENIDIQQIKDKKKDDQSSDKNDIILPNTDRLVHVSAMIDLKQTQSSLQQNCQNTSFQQMFALFGASQNTISLVVLCYNTQNYLMQEFVFQNPFTYNQTRVFPFFDYQVDSEAPHYTDRSIIYISTHYQLRSGTMKAYLMYSIYDFTPNSAVFEVITCYPTQDPNSFILIDCVNSNSKKKQNENKFKPYVPFTYFQYSELYGNNYQPSIIGIPFQNTRQKTISLSLFSFNNQMIINYLNYYPQLYANTNLGADVKTEINLNMIISKINLRDIHFNQYDVSYDLTDSIIQITGGENSKITLSNSKTESSVYCIDYQFPITQVSGPIESYEIQMYKNGEIVSVNDQVTDYNSFFGDYLVLEKYYYSYLETHFTYGEISDILNFSSYQFTANPKQSQDNCEDCQNLIAVISDKYLFLIEREHFDVLKQTMIPVTKVVYKIDLPTLDKQQTTSKDGECRMTLNNNSQILVYCVSNQKSTIFKLYQVSYKKLDPGATTVTSRIISSTGGFIGYVDEIIPFDYLSQPFLVIKTHYILNQQMSIFKIAIVSCDGQVKDNNSDSSSNGSDCSLNVKQSFPTNRQELSDAYIVDYEVQLLINQDNQNDQDVIGMFLSNTTINIFFFKDISNTFAVTSSKNFTQDQIAQATQTDYQFDNIFIKILDVVSKDQYSFLLGTTLNTYEILYQNGQIQTQYTYGKYYQCEHQPGMKPVIFNLNGQPFQRKTNFYITDNPSQQTQNKAFLIQSVLSSCFRIPSTQRPVFDPDPAIFSKESQNMFYIQYYIKNKTLQSWPVRILTYPYSSKSKSYYFEGFSNSANESRIIVSNFSYFLVEHQVQNNLNLNLTLSKDSADTLVVSLINGFNQKQMNFTVSYDDVIPTEKNQVWFIILIVVISVIAIVALIFIVLWIKKQRNTKNEKKKERMISSGITDISDHKSENLMPENPRQLPAPSKLFTGSNQYHHDRNHQEENHNRNSEMFQLVEGKKSLKYNRLSMQVDNLLRSVSMMQKRNGGDPQHTEIIAEQEDDQN